jgi:SAM-dependent methyltransferase
MTQTVVDYEAIKQKQHAAWESADYPRIGNTLQIIAEQLVESARIGAGKRVLDVACGPGNAAIAAARRFAEATGVDYITDQLVQARARAEAEHLDVEFTEADAEALPFPEQSFDASLSTIGVMFAPHQERAAAELVRVTRRGGTIALASWTPESMVASLFRTISSYSAPPAGLRSPMLWGTAERLTELFGDDVEWTLLTKRNYSFVYRSPEHYSAWFRRYYGPVAKLASTLDEATNARLAADIAAVPGPFNSATDGTMLAAGEYLEAVGIRR